MNQSVWSNDQETQQIIKTYTLLYNVIFRYGGFLLVLLTVIIISSISLHNILNTTPTTSNNQQDRILSKKISERLSQWSGIQDISIIIPWPYISATGQLFQASESMMTYHWLIMPRRFSFDRNINSNTFSTLLTPIYNIQTLQDFYQNIIFIIRWEIKPPAPITLLSLQTWSLFTTFNLTCSQWFRIIDGICQHYINNFISRMSAYDLSIHGNELFLLVNELSKSNPTTTQSICIGIQKSLLSVAQYSKNINTNSLRDVMEICNQYLTTNANRIQWFLSINNELSNDRWASVITDTIYPDPIINAYKLLSAQQLIYQNIQSGRPDMSRINWYLEFVQKLVNKPQNLSWATVDMIYFFHQHYLEPQLLNPQFAINNTDWNTKSITALKKIADIHQWNPLSETPGLLATLINKDLITLINSWIVLSNSWFQSTGRNTTGLTEQIVNSYLNTDRISIQAVAITWLEDTIDKIAIVQGTISVDNEQKKILIPTRITLSMSSQWPIITTMTFSGYQQLSTSVNTILSQRKISLGQLYDTIISNKSLFTTNTITQLSLCDSIKAYQAINESISSCSSSEIKLSQIIEWKTVFYTITMSWSYITTITSSHTGIQEQITIPKDMQTSISINNVLSSLLRLQPRSVTNNTQAVSPLATINDVRVKQLNTTPIDIKQWSKDNIFVVDFIMNQITRKVQYNNSNSTIERIIIIKDKQLIPVRNLSISLSSTSSKLIKDFLANPLSVIKEFDNAAYETYIK